jgi:putative chitinase
MVQTYPSRYAEIPHAIELGANARAKQLAAAGPQAVANDVYANQMGNGPDYTGDGWLFRGRYPVMLSGRALYTHCHAEIGVPNPLNPDALLSDIPAMARVSAWFWQHKELSVIANSSGDLRDVRRAWNGSLVGLDEVSLLYRDALIATGLA